MRLLSTVKSFLKEGKFAKGRDYAVLDNKKHLPGISFGEGRKLGLALDCLVVPMSLSVMGAGAALKSIHLFVGGATVFAANASLQRSVKKQAVRSEHRNYWNYFEAIRTHAAKAGLERGPVTHAVFTHFGGKTFLLNQQAADYLKAASKKRVRSLMKYEK